MHIKTLKILNQTNVHYTRVIVKLLIKSGGSHNSLAVLLSTMYGGVGVNLTITKKLFFFKKDSSDGPNMFSINGTLLPVEKDNIEAKHATC